MATVNVKDMSFEMKDIVPGKYKIGISITPYAGEKGSEKRAPAFDALNKAFAPTATSLSFEVAQDSAQSIAADRSGLSGRVVGLGCLAIASQRPSSHGCAVVRS